MRNMLEPTSLGICAPYLEHVPAAIQSLSGRRCHCIMPLTCYLCNGPYYCLCPLSTVSQLSYILLAEVSWLQMASGRAILSQIPAMWTHLHALMPENIYKYITLIRTLATLIQLVSSSSYLG